MAKPLSREEYDALFLSNAIGSANGEHPDTNGNVSSTEPVTSEEGGDLDPSLTFSGYVTKFVKEPWQDIDILHMLMQYDRGSNGTANWSEMGLSRL